MSRVEVTISFDEEKYEAVSIYLDEKGVSFEDAMNNALDSLYTKNVPKAVKVFLQKRNAIQSKPQQDKR